MSTPKRGLGRGLKSLIHNPAQGGAAPPPGLAADRPAAGRSVQMVPLGRIRPSPWQPRRTFAAESLAELADSVKERGILQPLLVRRAGDGFELIAGERRWRAAGAAGLPEAPVIVMDAADKDALELALIENVQREDLNVIEEAEAYKALADKFGLTQEAIAERTGKARASVANTMRLLNLAPPVRQMLAENKLTAGHAKVLLGVADEEQQRLLALRAFREELSVRELERRLARPVKPAPGGGTPGLPATHATHLSDLLQRHFGTRVRIVPLRGDGAAGKARGKIEVDYYSHDDLDRILGLCGLSGREGTDLSRI